ncbi:MAG: hypothetical protein NC204_05555 [Candidatus Amulumruptor caecigallinarius]|nr:hypothetical protein [Candidatus Amulumruptor caecigallinarius]
MGMFLKYGVGMVSVFFAMGMLVCCGSESRSKRPGEARQLYLKSVQLTEKYTDSLKLAKDSAEVLRLSANYEDAMTKLNFSFPSDIDQKMSEGENDTIKRASMNFVALRDSLLIILSGRTAQVADSLAAGRSVESGEGKWSVGGADGHFAGGAVKVKPE